MNRGVNVVNNDVKKDAITSGSQLMTDFFSWWYGWMRNHYNRHAYHELYQSLVES